MKKVISLSVLLIIFLSSNLLIPNTVHAEDDNCANVGDPTEKSKCLNDLIAKYQQQLNDARGQEKTLKSQLTYIDTQTKVTELKVAEAENQIAKLEHEIDDLSGRITRLSETLDSLSEVLLNRIVQTYKHGNYSSIDLLFSSNGFSDLLERVKYISVAQANDKKVLYQLQATKATYNDQKVDKEARQAQQEKLKKDLEKYQTQLADQKKQKDSLLKITQNNETIYQQKILAAQQEQQAILAILNGRGEEVADGHVNKGDIIGHYITYQFNANGSSPCSSGIHLHFEVHQNNSIQDPNNYLTSTNFQYSDNDGGKNEGSISPHGSLDWPISQPISITQGYGMTPYATGEFDHIKHYNGGPHTGIDMWTPPGVTAVKAVHEGTKYTGQLVGICSGGPLRYKRVDHGDGISSLYLHVL